MKLIKKILNFTFTLSLSVLLLFLAQEFVKEAETYMPVDYADVKGCTAEDFDFKWCT